ncbi:MAG: aldehyde dehydrogenase family protein [Gammaproteobacteria bacterium]|nr:aldehyde dehydrogenase family protein [Gemmatimonadota bacterium]NIU73043.1 aldehyde dehydrogenase family protein [Gammaproteobacteria bacterium]NIY07555.1 aldehyde dehydrogenase family protein [Gemmatimonadota bacterium]
MAGEWVEPSTGEYSENRNPARWDEVLGRFPSSGPEDVEKAVESAKRGFAAWRKVPAPQRGDVLRRVGDLMTARKREIAEAMTREMGKILDETEGDVQEGIDTAYYAASEGRRLFGHTVPSELRDKWAMSYRRPIGVCGIITPFNFPMAIPTWKIFPALVSGNAVIFKPAHDVPHTATLLVEILLEAGVHPEAVQLVHGSGSQVGNVIVEHPEVPVISFTGSTGVGSKLGETCGRMHKRLSLEMGGKNAQIVMPDANMELALEGVLWGAFGTTGQRCTATSRLLLHEAIHDEFVERLVDRVEALKLGDGLLDETDVGPMINEAAVQKTAEYVEIARQEGDEVLTGGQPATGGDLAGGWFFEPTVLTGVRAGSRLACEEIFGPVLSVIEFGDLDEAIRINNEVEYGLSSSIYTEDVRSSFLAMTELDNGITYINAPTIGAEAHLPFGGVKQTGNGHREGGWEVYEFYTETKVVYVDYSGRLQRAQIDTYDHTP